MLLEEISQESFVDVVTGWRTARESELHAGIALQEVIVDFVVVRLGMVARSDARFREAADLVDWADAQLRELRALPDDDPQVRHLEVVGRVAETAREVARHEFAELSLLVRDAVLLWSGPLSALVDTVEARLAGSPDAAASLATLVWGNVRSWADGGEEGSAESVVDALGQVNAAYERAGADADAWRRRRDERAELAFDAGVSKYKIAQTCGLNETTVARLLTRRASR